MENFKQLIVWKRSVNLAIEIYSLTSSFPSSEIYGLTSQTRRSAVSISSNIAEGAGRKSEKEFARFLRISYGSACELETQLIISRELNYLADDQMIKITRELNEIQKMIYTLELKKNQSRP